MDNRISRSFISHSISNKTKKKGSIEISFFDLLFSPYFCGNSSTMEQTKKYTGIWWLVFLASTAAMVLAIVTHWEWLTLILPFQTTAFVKAMDIM